MQKLAASQGGVVSREQMRELGWSYKSIQWRTHTGALIDLGAGVFAYGHEELEDRGRQHAALLAAGDGSAISHWTALVCWGLTDRVRRVVDVSTVTRNRCGRCRGVNIHRPRRLSVDEITTRRKVRLTTIPRTLWDVTPTVSDAELRRFIEMAVTTHHLDLGALRAYARHRKGLPGSARLASAAAAVAGPVRLRSDLETAFRTFCEERGFPTYAANVPFERWSLDVFWVEEGVAVELDWYRWHGAQSNYRIDRKKGLAVARAGIHLVRVAGEDLEDDPDDVDETLRAVLSRRIAPPHPDEH